MKVADGQALVTPFASRHSGPMTGLAEPDFTIGIEEEYLLVNRDSRDLVQDPPEDILQTCTDRLGEQVSAEYLRCQVEVGTKVCTSGAEARHDLVRLRRCVIDAAAAHGLAPIAAAHHPFAKWREQARTDKPRYNELAENLRSVAERMLICGMHVHIGVGDESARIDTMNQLTYFLPHILALTCSSPFFEANDTGLACHRLSIFDAMPRSGLPPRFDGWQDYQSSVGALVEAGVLEDATKVWWDLRPSHKYPTIEVRICDVCPRLDDAVAVACLLRCLARFLHRLRSGNQRWRIYERFLVDENRWRAQRYGVSGSLIDFGKREMVPYADLLADLLDLVAPDAAHFGCEAELQRLTQIATDGASSDRQRAVRDTALLEGRSENDALRAVVDHLVEETAQF